MATDDTSDATQFVNEKISSLNAEESWQPDPAAGLAALRARRTLRQRSAHRRIWMTSVAIVLGIGVPAAFGPRAFAARCVDACVVITSRVGQLLGQGRRVAEPAREGAAPLSVGNEIGALAPDFTLVDAHGGPVQLAQYRGQVVLLNFWATWCGPCRVEIPWFDEFHTRYGAQGLTVLGISLDDDGWKAVTPFAAEEHIGYRLALGNDDVSDAYGGLGALPATYLIDRQGRIVIKHVGLVAKVDYETEIVRLLAR